KGGRIIEPSADFNAKVITSHLVGDILGLEVGVSLKAERVIAESLTSSSVIQSSNTAPLASGDKTSTATPGMALREARDKLSKSQSNDPIITQPSSFKVSTTTAVNDQLTHKLHLIV